MYNEIVETSSKAQYCAEYARKLSLLKVETTNMFHHFMQNHTIEYRHVTKKEILYINKWLNQVLLTALHMKKAEEAVVGNDWCCNFVEKQSFKQLVKTLDPSQKVPCRKYF